MAVVAKSRDNTDRVSNGLCVILEIADDTKEAGATDDAGDSNDATNYSQRFISAKASGKMIPPM